MSIDRHESEISIDTDGLSEAHLAAYALFRTADILAAQAHPAPEKRLYGLTPDDAVIRAALDTSSPMNKAARIELALRTFDGWLAD